MTAVDPVYAQWLMADALYTIATDGTLAARWGAAGMLSTRTTTIANKADADTEGARQIAFLGGGGPLAIEEHQLPGSWAPYFGRVITLTAPLLGYDAGLDVFVIGAQDNKATGLSTVTVIRRL